jgi:hypothetical protein
MTYSLVFGSVYSASLAMRKNGVPPIVDSLPPSRIFNATRAVNRYALLGADYRHEVITMFRGAEPHDVRDTRAQYVLLSQTQVPAFTATEPLQLVESGPAMYGDTLSLWRVLR